MKILYALVTLCAAASVYAAGGFGDVCTTTSDCTDNAAECDANKKCSCADDKLWDDKSCVAKNTVDPGAFCQTKTGTCPSPGYRAGSCDEYKHRCECDALYHWNGTKCTKSIGEDCTATSDCGDKDAECIDNANPNGNKKCSCPANKLWDDKSCVDKTAALEAAYCDTKSSGACTEAGYNSSSPCDVYRHRCDCAQFYQRDGATCKKSPEYERKCTRNEDCTASGYKKSCSPTNRNCLCDQDYMSNGTICVHKPTPPLAYCEKNEDCKDSNYTSSCVIDDHRCSCAPGYKIQGFSCVKSDGVAILGSAMLAILTALFSQLC